MTIQCTAVKTWWVSNWHSHILLNSVQGMRIWLIIYTAWVFAAGVRNLLISLITRAWVRGIINNYWMRLSMISWIIKTEVCDICRSRRLRQITQTRGFDSSWYHAKTKFNNCFIIHFSHKFILRNRSEALSHFVSEEKTPRGLVTRQTLNLTR